MNLTTAKHLKRAKEIGVRKAIGTSRIQLAKQFLTESLFICTLAFIVSLVIVLCMIPWVNELAEKELTVLWMSPVFWMASLCFVLITSLMAGSYPALYLSSLNAQKALKGNCLLYTSPSPRDKRQSRMPSSA